MSFRGSNKAFCLLRSPTPTELNKSCIYSYPLVTSQAAWPACDVPGSHVTIVWPQCNAASRRKREIERSGDQLDCRLLVTYAGSPSCVWFASRVEHRWSAKISSLTLIKTRFDWKRMKVKLRNPDRSRLDAKQLTWYRSYHQDALGLGGGMWCLEVTSVLSLLILFIRAKLCLCPKCWLGLVPTAVKTGESHLMQFTAFRHRPRRV